MNGVTITKSERLIFFNLKLNPLRAGEGERMRTFTEQEIKSLKNVRFISALSNPQVFHYTDESGNNYALGQVYTS